MCSISLLYVSYIIDAFFEINRGTRIYFYFCFHFIITQCLIVSFAKIEWFREITINLILCHIREIIWMPTGNNFMYCLFYAHMVLMPCSRRCTWLQIFTYTASIFFCIKQFSLQNSMLLLKFKEVLL